MITGVVLRFLPLIFSGLVAGAGAWWVMDLRADNAALRADLKAITLQLQGCTSRISNIQKDKESDAQVDNMPDLTIVPDSWLFPVEPEGAGPSTLY
ncbi:MAG: hypothetical protein CL484_03245 [Acidobacteria bacterium]|nr:hypothetical protein [Acidobacteriota bacterium]